jgi:hypothetical protein
VAPLIIAHKKANVSAVTMPVLDDIIKDLPPSPEQIVGWCTQYDDPELTDALVAAFQHSKLAANPDHL